MSTFNTSVIFLLVFSYLKSLASSEFTCPIPGSLLFHLCLFLTPKYHQFSSVAQSCLTLCNSMACSTPGFPVHHQVPEPTQTLVHCIGDAIQPSHPLSSPSPPALSLSQHQGLSSELALHIRWPKFWSFRFSPANEYSGLISFRMDWLDLLAVQGTLEGLLQNHSSKASILHRPVFFMVQLSHPYMTTGKTIALTQQTFVGKVMSLLFNMLSMFVIAFLPRSKGGQGSFFLEENK